MYKNDIVAGVVYDPNRDELFTAQRGQGAVLNDEKISVSGNEKLEKSLISTGFAYDLEKKTGNLKKFELILNKAQAVRRPGAAAIDLCYVACGRFDAFWESYLSAWDTAAGQLIVKEAGGRITGFQNEEYNIFDKHILASNALVHEEIIQLFRQDNSGSNKV
jgi:myo-inositol-1(or 4)-monophosphatase